MVRSLPLKTEKCTICKNEFTYQRLRSKNHSLCKKCKDKAYDKIYKSKHRDSDKARHKAYHIANRDKISKRHKKTYNKERQLVYNKEYRAKNIDKRLEYDKNYYRSNKEKVRNKNKKIANRRYNQDPIYRLRRRVSATIRKALKKLGTFKNHPTWKVLPYTPEELKQHLEAQFEPWMNWNNHGLYRADKWDDDNSATWTWQIDHIIPQTILPYIDMKEDNFRKCWALENLRPLNAKQNFLDGVKRIRHI